MNYAALATRTRRVWWLPALLVPALLAWSPAAWPGEPAPAASAGVLLAQAGGGEREQVASQLANVRRLLEGSSGAHRVLDSENELAKNIRLDAVQRHRKAQAAYEAGDYAMAHRLLDEAAKVMFQAIRMLGPAAELTEKKVGDFDARAESTRVLLDALQRIAAEEGTQGAAANTAQTVENTISEARKLLEQGRHKEARKLLDGGYELAKAAVESLRDGKTLVRSLNFESPEAEYHYELDRNDTHHMLVRVVLKEKQPGAQAAAMVQQSVQRAGDLRRQAEELAAGGKYEEAIQVLEQSTKELVRAIRGAGLYIPG